MPDIARSMVVAIGVVINLRPMSILVVESTSGGGFVPRAAVGAKIFIPPSFKGVPLY
jgi:hypothetical protein